MMLIIGKIIKHKLDLIWKLLEASFSIISFIEIAISYISMFTFKSFL